MSVQNFGDLGIDHGANGTFLHIDDGHIVAQVYGGTAWENILAASPDVYEALKAHTAARDHHKDCIRCDWEPCEEWWKLYWIAVGLTDAAQAKAEGRSE